MKSRIVANSHYSIERELTESDAHYQTDHGYDVQIDVQQDHASDDAHDDAGHGEHEAKDDVHIGD